MSGPAPLRRGLAARFLGAGALPSAGVLAVVERGEGVGIDLPLSADAAPEAFAHRAMGVLPALHLGLTPGVPGQAAVTVTSDLPALHGLEQTRTVLPQEDTRVEVRPGVARTAGVTVQNLRWLIAGPTPICHAPSPR